MAPRLLTFALAALMLVSELAIGLMAVWQGIWSYHWALPLQICDIALAILVLTLLYPKTWAWLRELAYFWVIGGSTVAVLTPDMPLPFPNPYYILFFTTHGGALITVLYLVGRGEIVLTRSSLARAWLISHAYAALIGLVNSLLATNYLYLCGKPEQLSVLNVLGPWPYYLLYMELFFSLSLLLGYLLYLPLQKLVSCSLES